MGGRAITTSTAKPFSRNQRQSAKATFVIARFHDIIRYNAFAAARHGTRRPAASLPPITLSSTADEVRRENIEKKRLN